MSALVERIIAARDSLKRRERDVFLPEVLSTLADSANTLDQLERDFREQNALGDEMLSALKWLLAEWDSLGCGDDDGNPIPDSAPCATKARAVIAKVEGRT